MPSLYRWNWKAAPEIQTLATHASWGGREAGIVYFENDRQAKEPKSRWVPKTKRSVEHRLHITKVETKGPHPDPHTFPECAEVLIWFLRIT